MIMPQYNKRTKEETDINKLIKQMKNIEIICLLDLDDEIEQEIMEEMMEKMIKK